MPGTMRLEVRVHGMVQGVGFRYSTVREVRTIGGIVGYVRNAGDGTVEVVAEGAEERLKSLERWLESGPPGSIVRRIEAEYLPAIGRWDSFDVGY